MTSTDSPVTRRTIGEYRIDSRRAPIVVTIARKDTLIFKVHASRRHYSIAIDDAFRYAIALTADKIRRHAAELRKSGLSRREARRRAEAKYLTR